jgi:hypothetical protein
LRPGLAKAIAIKSGCWSTAAHLEGFVVDV